MSGLFKDWSRVRSDTQTGVVVWDPGAMEYKVLWDNNGWEGYPPTDAKRLLKEVT